MKEVNNNRTIFSGWFVPSGERKRLSFFLSNILLLLLTLIVYGIFSVYFFSQFLLIFTQKFSFSNSLLFVFFVGLIFLYIGTMFIIQRLRDIGVKNNKILIFVFICLFVTHIIDIFLPSNILSTIISIVDVIFFLFLLFCPSNYLNLSSK